MSSKNILELEDKGVVRQIVSDKFNMVFVIQTSEDWQQVTTYNDGEIISTTSIGNSKILNGKKIIWTKPKLCSDGEHVIKGLVHDNNCWKSFIISNSNLIIATDGQTNLNNPFAQVVPSRYKIENFVQKGNFLYFVGTDEDQDEPVYVKFNLASKRIEDLYSYFSDVNTVTYNSFAEGYIPIGTWIGGSKNGNVFIKFLSTN